MPSETGKPSTRLGQTGWAQAGILLAVWVVLVGVVIGVGRVITGPLRRSMDPPENDLARWFVDSRSSLLTPLADFGTLLGDIKTVVALGLAMAVVVWLWRREARPVVFVVTTMVGVTGLYLLAVTADPRPRPPVEILDPGLDPTHSFPSGHVGASMAVYGGLVVLVWTYARRMRWLVTPLLLLVPPVVAVSRLYEGAHPLSDVLTSVAYGAVWLVATTVVLLAPDRTPPVERPGAR